MPATIMWSGVRSIARRVLVSPIEERLKQMIWEVCQQHQAEIEELEVMPDHIHLLVSVDPQFGIRRLIKLVTGRSSRLLRQAFPVLNEAKIANLVDQ